MISFVRWVQSTLASLLCAMSGKRKAPTSYPPQQSQEQESYDESGRRSASPDTIPRTLPWSKDNSYAVHKFIAEMERPENFIILFGKKDKKDVSYHHNPFYRLCSEFHRTHRVTQRWLSSNALGKQSGRNTTKRTPLVSHSG